MNVWIGRKEKLKKAFFAYYNGEFCHLPVQLIITLRLISFLLYFILELILVNILYIIFYIYDNAILMYHFFFW